MRDVQKALWCTGELMVPDAIIKVEIVNMVTEGIQQAMKNPPSMILNKHCQETTNLVKENANMQQKHDDMHQLFKKFQEQMSQQQPPQPAYVQQQQPCQQQQYYQKPQPFQD
eukprot:2702992-Ditylum_brightwellii.AAC.1